MNTQKTKVRLPGTTVVVNSSVAQRQFGSTALSLVHEHLFTAFLGILKERYATKKTENPRVLINGRKASEKVPLIEVDIPMSTLPFGCGQAIWAAGDFVSMDIKLWGKGWSGCYLILSRATFLSGDGESPAVRILVDEKVAKRLMAR